MTSTLSPPPARSTRKARASFLQVAVIVPSLVAITPAAAVAAAEEPIPLDPGPHLFIDDHLIAVQDNVRRVVSRPERLPQPVVTGPEDKCFQPYLTVLRDPATGRFRIWYGIPESASQSHLGYLESEDGIRWLRPHRVLEDPAPIQFGVSIIDEGPDYPDPSRRYKYGWYHGDGLRVAASPDGLAWRPISPRAVLRHDHDINSIAWDPIRGRYIALVSSYTTGPTWSGRRRIPMTSVSGDLLRWREPWRIFTPDGKDEGETQFYCMAGVLARGGLLVGLLKVLRDDLPADPGGPAAGIGYTVLAWSRDGERWERDREPFLERNPTPGTWDHAMTWGDGQLLVGDETFIYYGGYARGHKVERFRERQIGLARMPRDRYVAREAGDARGLLRTRLVALRGQALALNASAGEKGELRARLIDGAGQPLAGFDWEDGPALQGDSLAHPLRWKGDLAALGGSPVRLELALREAKVYGVEILAGPR
ncbi:MAG: hypothetical protein HY721_02560 [Planctomycetes bacterium]|nr:hypothetical protein [Planctomycetota bacterium]